MTQYYRARHILLEDAEDALEMLELLNSGSSFESLAQEYSECNSGEKGGDLGRFSSGSMVAEFERALYHMKVGEISKPIESKFGFHIIERLELN
jgi:parvulin-like peptidyl-prolyl isomerase